MCGRYTLATPDPAALRGRFGLEPSIEVRRRHNVAPGDDVLAVSTDREGRPRGEHLRWGLVPSWADSPDTGLKMINARAETAAEKPAFRGAFQRFRCLILADGFYEWQGRAGRPKQPFWITRADGEPFAFAGLWSIWHPRQGGGAPLRSCTILTTAANAAIAPLHDRMPVILASDAEAPWLDHATPPAALDGLLRGLTPGETALREVGRAVNDARHDEPDCLEPPAPEPQTALF